MGGHLTGTPTYSYERGPDGVNYAVEGQVSVKSPEVPGDPEKTLQQAEQIRRAALAPAEPSAADRQVAADAARVAAEARAELARGDEDTDAPADSDRKDDIASDGSDVDGDGASSEPRRSADTSSEAAAGQAGAALYRDIENGVPNAGPGRVTLQA